MVRSAYIVTSAAWISHRIRQGSINTDFKQVTGATATIHDKLCESDRTEMTRFDAELRTE